MYQARRRLLIIGGSAVAAFLLSWKTSAGQEVSAPPNPRRENSPEDPSHSPLPTAASTKAVLEQHQKDIKRDIEKLYDLATQLKTEVEKTDATTVLSLGMVKKAEEIEKLAKQDVYKRQGLESGADDYLTKPFNVDELKARLRTGERILLLEGRLVEAREMMRFKATHDALTSIWNRGVIMDLLGRELVRSNRESVCTVMLLGDVDHFKLINDTHGHPVGDEVLQEIARRLLLSIRSYDFVGRYGGEEFLLVLNNCNPEFAAARAEEVRKVVSSRPIQTAAGELQVTMSFGLLLSKDWGVRPVEELLYEVDAALYAAKAAGRNSIRMARPNLASSVLPVHTGEAVHRLR